MTVPPWMAPDDETPPTKSEAFRPFVLDQRPGPDGTVYVTVSLPGLRTMTVAVPETSWIDGEHIHLGTLATTFLDSLLPDIQTEDDGSGDDTHDSGDADRE